MAAGVIAVVGVSGVTRVAIWRIGLAGRDKGWVLAKQELLNIGIPSPPHHIV
jgi:hypothetical protein